jgi:hypothetical protein
MMRRFVSPFDASQDGPRPGIPQENKVLEASDV